MIRWATSYQPVSQVVQVTSFLRLEHLQRVGTDIHFLQTQTPPFLPFWLIIKQRHLPYVELDKEPYTEYPSVIG